LWDKTFVQKARRICYELNGAFAALLKEIGFDVTYLNARVFGANGKLGIDFDHLALLVRIRTIGTLAGGRRLWRLIQ
jgi:N-hydroxyarylamine O-acetyltransferase